MVLASLIAFAKEALPYEEQNLISVCKLNRVLGTPEGERIFAELEAEFPESFAVKKYKEYRNVFNAEKTWYAFLKSSIGRWALMIYMR